MVITICIITLVFAGVQALMDILEEMGCWTPVLILLLLFLLLGAAVSAERGFWSILRSL